MPSWTRKQKRIAVLTKARALLDSSPTVHQGICYWLTEAAAVWMPGRKLGPTARELRKEITGALGGVAWLSTWLLRNRHTSKKFLRTQAGEAKLKATRLAWLDYLIKKENENG